MFLKKLLCGKKQGVSEKPKTRNIDDFPEQLTFNVQMDNIQGKNFKHKDTFLKIKFPNHPILETHYVYRNNNPTVG